MWKTLVRIMMLLLFSFQFTQVSKAASHVLSDLHIDVKINQDGSANITETRVVNLSKGTENYIVIENLGKSKIQDFKVSENGQEYEQVEKWNVNASQQDKAFKNGLIKTKKGYELCWGIGEYGRHTYVVEYVVTDFIKNLKDAQILYWQFVNPKTDIPPHKVTVHISTTKSLNPSNEKIWAFGYDGEIQFVNGDIIAQSQRPFSKSNYLTILVKFPPNVYGTTDQVNKSFNQIQQQAFKGSDYDQSMDNISQTSAIPAGALSRGFSFSSIGKTLFLSLFPIAIFGLLIVGFIVLVFAGKKMKSGRTLFYGRKYKGEYYRDYPYEGSLIDTFYLSQQMRTSNFETLFTALLLKWIKNEHITISSEVSGVLKREQSILTFVSDSLPSETDPNELQLYLSLRNAVKENHRLNEKELASWAYRNMEHMKQWVEQVHDTSAKKLQQLQYLSSEEKKVLFVNRTVYTPTEKGQQLEKQIHQFINYLHDYSLLNEHEAVNVHLWDELMIWAAYFGITEVVMKQFQALYPTYLEESAFHNERTLIATRALSSSTSHSISRSSGEGGSSSSGGGGGSYGGGSGGGTR